MEIEKKEEETLLGFMIINVHRWDCDFKVDCSDPAKLLASPTGLSWLAAIMRQNLKSDKMLNFALVPALFKYPSEYVCTVMRWSSNNCKLQDE
jgi:hypothetical protein